MQLEHTALVTKLFAILVKPALFLDLEGLSASFSKMILLV
jgi:hypothetical protein